MKKPNEVREEIIKRMDRFIQPKMPSIAVVKGYEEAADSILEYMKGIVPTETDIMDIIDQARIFANSQYKAKAIRQEFLDKLK